MNIDGLVKKQRRYHFIVMGHVATAGGYIENYSQRTDLNHELSGRQ